MNGKELLVDTNILLYLLKGNDTLAELLEGKIVYISFITELELLGYGKMTEVEQNQIKQLLEECIAIPLSATIKKSYVEVRKKSNLKLADAVIAATALALNIPLITSDVQFKTVSDINLICYEV